MHVTKDLRVTLCALRRTYQLDQAAMLQVGDRSQGEATCETRAYVGLQEECLSDMGQGFSMWMESCIPQPYEKVKRAPGVWLPLLKDQ